MTTDIETIKAAIEQALSADELELPTLPEVAIRVREAAEDDDVSIKSFSEVIASDTGLAARIIRVSNSSMFRAAQPIENLQTAVGRLGIEFTCNIATGFAMQQMFQATSDVIDKKLRTIWSHSMEVAAIAQLLSRNVPHLKPDLAMLAGLTHTIGALPLLVWAEEHAEGSISSFELDEIIETLHPGLGTRILEHWDFPPELIPVPENFLDLHREVPQADYVDVVMVAHLQTLAGTDHPLGTLDWSEIPAFERMGMLDGVEDLTEEMSAAMESLSDNAA